MIRNIINKRFYEEKQYISKWLEYQNSLFRIQQLVSLIRIWLIITGILKGYKKPFIFYPYLVICIFKLFIRE